MAGILGSVVGSSSAGSRSIVDYLGKTITSDNENPKGEIVTMLKTILDIPTYDNDVETFDVIQKKGGKGSMQSLWQHEGLLLRLVHPQKNPENRILKVDLMTIKPENVAEEIKRIKDEYESSATLMAEYLKPIDGITIPCLPKDLHLLEQIRKRCLTGTQHTSNELEVLKQGLVQDILYLRRIFERILENSLLFNLNSLLFNLKQTTEFYQRYSIIDSIDKDSSEVIFLYSNNGNVRIKLETLHCALEKDSNTAMEILHQQDSEFLNRIDTLLKESLFPKNVMDEIEKFWKMPTSEALQFYEKDYKNLEYTRENIVNDIQMNEDMLDSVYSDADLETYDISFSQCKEVLQIRKCYSNLLRIDSIRVTGEGEIVLFSAFNQPISITLLKLTALLKLDATILEELNRQKIKLKSEIDTLTNKKQTLNQIGLSINKENVVLKLTNIDENSEEGINDGRILKQVAIKKTIKDLAKVLSGHYSDFGNYRLFTNDCRHYVANVLEDLELNKLSTLQNLLENASPLIASFRDGDLQGSDLLAISKELDMKEEYDYMRKNPGEFNDCGDKAESLLKKWFLAKGRSIATVDNLLNTLKQKEVGLTSIAEEIVQKCGHIDDDDDDDPTLVKLMDTKDDEADCLQKLRRLKEDEMFSILPIFVITRSTCLIRYTGPNGGPWHGTGFLSTLAYFNGLILFSAGHNFEDDGFLLDDYSNFNLFFNNMSGIQNESFGDKESIPLNLGNLIKDFDCTLVVTYNGNQCIHKKNDVPQRSTLKGDDAKLDYFALIFHGNDVQERMERKGLRFLHCASSHNISPKRGAPVLIFGHPGMRKCRCPERDCTCNHPLRISYGKETGSSKHRIEYNLDTLGGNSGSAITGKQYTVKGIHVSGKNANKAQSMESVLKDLRKKSILPDTT